MKAIPIEPLIGGLRPVRLERLDYFFNYWTPYRGIETQTTEIDFFLFHYWTPYRGIETFEWRLFIGVKEFYWTPYRGIDTRFNPSNSYTLSIEPLIGGLRLLLPYALGPFTDYWTPYRGIETQFVSGNITYALIVPAIEPLIGGLILYLC